jgi:hypothetical protein
MAATYGSNPATPAARNSWRRSRALIAPVYDVGSTHRMGARMSPSTRWLLTLSLVVLLPACSQTASDDTTPAVTAAPGATPAPVADAASKPPADADEDDGFVLTMDKVDAYYATIGNIARASQEDPAMEDIAAQEGDETAAQYAARMQADPKARALLTSAGLSIEEFAQVNEALLAGMMTAGALESGALKAIPDGINPQYVDFAREHKAELEAKVTALQKSLGG